MMQPVSQKERFALGQRRRKQMRRLEHKIWAAKDRREDPLKLLAHSTRGRVPSLLAVKNDLMAASPFGYFRGAVPVMAYDLSLVGNTGICNQLCGDAHVRNLGAFAGADGRLAFDINDFDETIVAPFEWDVKRMATSLILAGRAAGVKDVRCREVAAVFLDRYRASMASFARMPVLELARYQVHRLGSVSPVAEIFHMAERSTAVHTLQTLTEARERPDAAKKDSAKKDAAKKDSKTKRTSTKHTAAARQNEEPGAAQPAALKTAGERSRVFRNKPPMLRRVTGTLADEVVRSLTAYAATLQPERRHFLKQYRPVDVAFKVVGTGSVGLRDYVVYCEGNGAKDPLFLQVKEETASGYAPYAASFDGAKGGAKGGARGGGKRGAKSKATGPEHTQHNGRRVVEGERAMQLQSDPFLGWTTLDGREYLVRQLNDHKASIQLEDLKVLELMEYAAVCGELLARGHARAGDAAVIAGYLGSSSRFDDAVGSFAEAYADQTELDWKQLVRSLKRTGSRPAAKS